MTKSAERYFEQAPLCSCCSTTKMFKYKIQAMTYTPLNTIQLEEAYHPRKLCCWRKIL